MNLQDYINEVNAAVALLASADFASATRPEDVHPAVRDAHRHLHKLCRRYVRHRIFRYFIVWGEEQAVAAGFMSFDMVEKP